MSKSTNAPENKAQTGDKIWAMMALVSGVAAAKVASKVLSTGWTASTGRKPPANPADPDVSLAEAVMWSAATGAAIAITRMFVQRRAANYYLKSVGRLPKQLEKDGS
ncbi:DUF4235 domain-containing protein [Nocardioides sp. CCNWLW239]|uniref:DUF4235 domain-containing protein n=1 Tax=Nocardioides sp. CCNWLW239 TaxID=3128902 RepID=UPI003016E5AF